MTTTSSALRAIEAQIHDLTSATDEDLLLLERVIERAYVHVMIERHLRHNSHRVS